MRWIEETDFCSSTVLAFFVMRSVLMCVYYVTHIWFFITRRIRERDV